MDYAMLQVFLEPRERPGLVAAMENLPAGQTRQGYLEEIFRGTQIDFIHRNTPYTYLHVAVTNGILVGVIGRQLQEEVNAGPEERFQIVERSDWYTANVFVNPFSTNNGQMIAFQTKLRIGVPLAVFSSLVEHINNRYSNSEWRMEVNPIRGPLKTA